MKFKNLIVSIGLSSVSIIAIAHPHKCQHSHNANGTIAWEENCGGRSDFNYAINDSESNRSPTGEGHYSKHNMLLNGSDEIFASHIVYKKPHNFQIILRVRFPEAVKQHYLNVRTNDPDAQIVFLLDPMDISAIAAAPAITGSLQERGSSNKIIVPHVTLQKKDFDVIFFDELPLDLNDVNTKLSPDGKVLLPNRS